MLVNYPDFGLDPIPHDCIYFTFECIGEPYTVTIMTTFPNQPSDGARIETTLVKQAIRRNRCSPQAIRQMIDQAEKEPWFLQEIISKIPVKERGLTVIHNR